MTERAAALSKSSGVGVSSAPDPLVGRLINDRFKIVALVARGGMGKVYRAEQAPLGRTCAVKVLDPNYAGEHDPEFHRRFFLEASVASRLTHPNTVTIFDYGRTDDDVYYMAMEYLEGHTLHRAIRDAGSFSEERTAHVARQICRALREAHLLEVIHRDLKPANVFLVDHADEVDFVKVLDFGLVKNVSETKGEDLTQTGLFMGSPKYMAPEQIRGDRVDARTDIYALGIILYEMLTGKVPFDRPNSVNILMAHVSEPAPPLREMNPAIVVSKHLEETVNRCMEKSPDRRFGSMDEVLVALKQSDGGAASRLTGGTSERPALSVSGGGREPANFTDIGSDPTFLSPSGSQTSTPFVRQSGSHGAGVDGASASAKGRGSRSMALGAVAGALAAVVLIAYIALRTAPHAQPQEPPKPTATLGEMAAPAAHTVTPERAPVVPAPPASVALRITTDPAGAKVREESIERCSSTPCEIVFRGSETAPDKEHKLTFLRPGYRQETRTVRAGDDAVELKLSPVAAGPRAAVPRTAPSPKSDTPPLPPGYKSEIPY